MASPTPLASSSARRARVSMRTTPASRTCNAWACTLRRRRRPLARRSRLTFWSRTVPRSRSCSTRPTGDNSSCRAEGKSVIRRSRGYCRRTTESDERRVSDVCVCVSKRGVAGLARKLSCLPLVFLGFDAFPGDHLVTGSHDHARVAGFHFQCTKHMGYHTWTPLHRCAKSRALTTLARAARASPAHLVTKRHGLCRIRVQERR